MTALIHAHPVLTFLILLILFCALIVWCLAGIFALKNAPLMEDVPAPKTPPGLRPEEAERPAMVPHKVDPVTPDRPMAYTLTIVYEVQEPRLDTDIDALCKEIEGGY
jgi:hypothetical protein